MRPINADSYKAQLRAIIDENPDYWLAEEPRRSWELMVEWVDRHRIKLGRFKKPLLQPHIPTMDTLIRRVREIKEDIDKQKQPPLEWAIFRTVEK